MRDEDCARCKAICIVVDMNRIFLMLFVVLMLCQAPETAGAGREGMPLAPGGAASAQSPIPRKPARKHELRLGVGDQLFESLVWQNPSHYVSNMPSAWTKTYKENYRYTQHWFLQYNYNVFDWLGVGAMADASGCLWDAVLRDGTSMELSREKNCSFWNLSIMPMLRFWWFHTTMVSMYTSIGAGLNVNGGSETDTNGKHTACGVALDLALIGLQIDWERYCAFVELGGLYSLKNTNTIFMFNSRIVSLGVGVKF